MQCIGHGSGAVTERPERTATRAHCPDEVQQANAITAAVREVALLVIQQHLAAGVEHAVVSGDGEAAVKDMLAVLRAAMRQ